MAAASMRLYNNDVAIFFSYWAATASPRAATILAFVIVFHTSSSYSLITSASESSKPNASAYAMSATFLPANRFISLSSREWMMAFFLPLIRFSSLLFIWRMCFEILRPHSCMASLTSS